LLLLRSLQFSTSLGLPLPFSVLPRSLSLVRFVPSLSCPSLRALRVFFHFALHGDDDGGGGGGGSGGGEDDYDDDDGGGGDCAT